MSSSDMAGDHLVGLVLRWLVSASACTGGTMWWWTSIRWAFTGTGACADSGIPLATSVIAAPPPDRKLRRLSPSLPRPIVGSQQAHREKNLRRPVVFMASPSRFLASFRRSVDAASDAVKHDADV
jgi:hypothetical protein